MKKMKKRLVKKMASCYCFNGFWETFLFYNNTLKLFNFKVLCY